MTTSVSTVPTQGHAPTPVVVEVNQGGFGLSSIGSNGPILPTLGSDGLQLAAKGLPAGYEAAAGAARFLLKDASISTVAEPVMRMSWGIAKNLLAMPLNLIAFRFDQALGNLQGLWTEGFVNLGSIAKRAVQPASLTAAAHGATRAGLGEAVGVAFQTAGKAFKSSIFWALPASAINAFVDYKYRDQTDPKRLATNFAADVIGYTATGMVGAGVGSAVGAMTNPLIGTLAGAAVGIGLGVVHDTITRPIMSDLIRDQLG